MAKKKDATALFEVISKAREKRSSAGLDVPAWMGPPGTARPAPPAETPPGAAPPRVPVAPQPTPAPAPVRRHEPPALLGPIGEIDAGIEPLVRTTGGRLRLSLNYVSCMVIFIGLVLLLVLAFALGRYTAEKSTPVATGGGESQAEKAGVAQGGQEVERPPIPPPGKRDPAKFYLIVQLMTGKTATDKEDAEKIVKFLSDNNVPADIGEFRVSGEVHYGVWSLTPFDSASSPDAQAFAKRIDSELGRKYFATHGKYKFQQRTSPSADLTPWFVHPPNPAGSR